MNNTIANIVALLGGETIYVDLIRQMQIDESKIDDFSKKHLHIYEQKLNDDVKEKIVSNDWNG